MPASILIVDDEKNTRGGLVAALEDDYEIFVASNADEAFRLLESEAFEVVLTDLRMAGKSGMSVIEKAVANPHKPLCIMMTAYGDVTTAVEAMKRGAYDFLTKPLNLEQLEMVIKRALKSKTIEAENSELHQRLDQKYSFQGVIGNSHSLQKVLEEVKQVSSAKSTVLILGETGTGKELVAQLIHQNSPRAHNQIISVHCASIASNLLESELFGHEKGAFTGAIEKRVGRFELADGGTLFLDEIGELDASTQVKLLRFLETKTFERLGSNNAIQIDCRLICATHRDLEAMIKKDEFREDLYYRLSVIPIKLPPLRDRGDDIPLLIDYYLKEFSKENSTPPLNIAPEAMKSLQSYSWPGNIRELRNFCENIVVMRKGGDLTQYDLDDRFTIGSPQSNQSPSNTPSLSKEENEKRLLRNALIQSGGNRTKAAALMGISRRTLHRKLQQWPELDTKNDSI